MNPENFFYYNLNLCTNNVRPDNSLNCPMVKRKDSICPRLNCIRLLGRFIMQSDRVAVRLEKKMFLWPVNSRSPYTNAFMNSGKHSPSASQ